MAKIEVGAHKFLDFNLVAYGHAYLRFTSDSGDQFVLRGGSTVLPPISAPWSTLTAEINKPWANSVDNPANAKGEPYKPVYRTVDLGNRDGESAWSIMIEAVESIRAGGASYLLFWNNCVAVVESALNAVGIDATPYLASIATEIGASLPNSYGVIEEPYELGESLASSGRDTDDAIRGHTEEDKVFGGEGRDQIFGYGVQGNTPGDWQDAVNYGRLKSKVIAQLELDPEADVLVTKDSGQDTLYGIEKLHLTKFDDVLVVAADSNSNKYTPKRYVDFSAGLDTIDISLVAEDYHIDLRKLDEQLIKRKSAPLAPIVFSNAELVRTGAGEDVVLGPDFKETVAGADPLVLDLDGDGLDLSGLSLDGPRFDIDGDGFAERTGWVGPNDGLLAFDADGDGRISSIDELFGAPSASGFAELTAWDENADNWIDLNDSGFDDLRVWIDANGDAKTDAGELKALSELDISALSLLSVAPDEDSSFVAGNSITATAEYIRVDGTAGTLADVSFVYETAGIVDGNDGGSDDDDSQRDPDGESEGFDFDSLKFYGGADAGDGEDEFEPGAVDSLIVGGAGTDTVDYSKRQYSGGKGLTFTAKESAGGETPIGKETDNATTVEPYRFEVLKQVTGAEEATDGLYQVELVKGTDSEDNLIVEDMPDGNSFGSDGPTVIDMGSQSDETARDERSEKQVRGDFVDVSQLSEGVVINLHDPANQFAAENDGSVDYVKYDPDAGMENLKFLQEAVKVAQGEMPVDDDYKEDERIGLKNVENATATDDDDIILGLDFSGSDAFEKIAVELDLKDGDDLATTHFARGEVKGGEGDDVIYAVDSVYVAAAADGHERMVVKGGEGNDAVIAIRGEGAVVSGGAGRDFLLNTSELGETWGGEVGEKGDGETDVFWFWPGTFIKDAEKNDVLQIFGFPLLGGSNAFAVEASQGGLVQDWIHKDIYYGAADGGEGGGTQLLIFYRPAAEREIGTERGGFSFGTMVVEDYDFGGIDPDRADFGINEPGDLGMTFRIYSEDGETPLSLFKAVWGHIITFAESMLRLAKLVHWKGVDDPLVLDLDGDGIETLSAAQAGVHFDGDGDYFAEATGWLDPDDGFLVWDRDGSGTIDDVSEMFGGPGVSAFDELAQYDDNADGVIDANDAVFAELAVWRDRDVDGLTGAGELIGLTALGIVSLDTQAAPLDRELAGGAELRGEATFTWADGSTGASYEAIFATDATDTIYRGDRGIADWLQSAPLPNAKGFGSMADLAVDMSNDFELADIVAEASAQMTAPSLKAIREAATPVFGAWAQSLETTRELTAVLVDADGANGATLIDRAVYNEDADGGYWTLASGAYVRDADGGEIVRATLEDVLAQVAPDGGTWRLEQVFSPASRTAPLAHRSETPYLVEILDGRPVIRDFAVENPGGSWRLASGVPILAADGSPVANPTVADILAQPPPEGTAWRVEEIGHNAYADLPVDRMGVNLVDGTVVDYSVRITDADGSFDVWARNLDRALELQEATGDGGAFNLRNYAVDFDTLDEAGSTDDSAYRVEVLTAGQLHFASSIYGIDFQPGIMAANIDPETGLIGYSTGAFNGAAPASVDAEGNYVSTIAPAIELFDVMMQNYIEVSRGFAVRLALQGGLSRFAGALDYDPATDKFAPATDRELAPVFEAIFAEAPAGAEPAYEYLVAWREILEVVYPDYEVDRTKNFVTGHMRLDEKFIFQMVLPAFETVGIDAELPAVLNALGVDETRLIAHDATASEVHGTDGADYIYVSDGDQTYYGGYGADVYFIGADFGRDIIEDTEWPFQGKTLGQDTLRFSHVGSSDVRATRDGLDLVIEVLGTDNVLRVRNQFEGELIDPLFGYDFSPDTEMVSIVFADGVIWDEWQIAREVSHPLATDDVVLGSQASDYLEGGRGNDILRGGRDGDIYVFNAGDGDDRISDDNDHPTDDPVSKYDLLQFGEGIALEDLQLRRAGESHDLEIIVTGADGLPTGDRIVVEDQFAWVNIPVLGLLFADAIERMSFVDGAYLGDADIMALVLEQATTDDADIIYGFNNADRLQGGGGDDLLVGRAQDDTYVFGRGDGRDVIRDGDDDLFAASNDTLVFEDGLRWTDFVFERDGNSATVTMRIEGSTDAVVLDQAFASELLFGFRNLIERFEFADGTTWDFVKLAQHVVDLAATDGDDTVYGFDLGDTLDGRAGDDRLEGGRGGDTYVFAAGHGTDTIFDAGSTNAADRVVFRDIAFGDVEISRSGEDLIFTLSATGERLVIEKQYVRAAFQGNAVESFVFADMAVSFADLNPEDVDTVGTADGETLYGSNFAETLDGRAGDDTLIGGSDGDTYLFDVGYGNDIIVDRQVRAAWFNHDGRFVGEAEDTVRFGGGIERDAISFARDGEDLVVSIAGRTDTLRIKNQFRDIEDAIERFEFSDGEHLTAGDIESLLSIADGSRGDDEIVGFADSENVLDGRQGDDRLIGGRLGDTYAFGAEYDLDEIVESDTPQAGAVDRVVFAASVAAETLRLSRSGDDLIIDLGNGNDLLTVTDGLASRQVEEFHFADGTVWTLEDVRERLLIGGSGDDVLRGFDDRDDTLDGGEGSDALEGGLGNDTYRFDLGGGADSVTETGGVDRIVFGEQISAPMVRFSDRGGDLVLHFDGAPDSLVIAGGASRDTAAGHVESFAFADGTTLRMEDVWRALLETASTPGSDVIDARFDGPSVVDGGTGGDLILAGTETTVVFREGDGFDILDTSAVTAGSGPRLIFESYTPAEAALRRVDLDGADILIAFPATGDQVLVRDGLTSARLSEIVFADGTVWSAADLARLAVAAQATDRADVITGSSAADDIEAGRGDDDIEGGFGDDVYRFERGDGRDIISDLAGTDRLEIRGYTPADMTVSRPVADRADLLLSFAGTDDEILLKLGVNRGIDTVSFGDGTELTRDDLETAALGAGTAFDDAIVGGASNDTLDGGAGNDALSGKAGADTYVFARGYGRDVIEDAGLSSDENRLLVRDYGPQDVSVLSFADRPDDLILRFGGGDEVVVRGGLNPGLPGIASIVFEDGTIWTMDVVTARLASPQPTDADDLVEGTAESDELDGKGGDDTILAGGGADTLAGGAGRDYVSGGDGSDSYVFRRGDGDDMIDDNGFGDTDRLSIEGYTPGEATFARGGAGGDLVITFAGTDDRITIRNGLAGDSQDGIEEIAFAEGTVLDADAVRASALAAEATAGDDRVVGFDTADELTGGAGSDFLSGGDGSDNYNFARGDGTADILDKGSFDTDRLTIEGYAPDEARLARFGRDLVLTFDGTDDRIVIRDTLEGSVNNQIEQIAFADGTVWFVADVRARVLSDAATAAGDSILGFDASSDVIAGGAGADFLSGGDRSDTYWFARGDGNDVIDEAGFADTDILHIAGYAASETILERAGTGDDLLVRFTGTTDTVLVRGGLSGSSFDTVEEIRFDDGTVWNLSVIQGRAVDDGEALREGTSGADTLDAGAGAEFLTGGGGSDTYQYSRGDGADRIRDNGFASTDRLLIHGYVAAEISLQAFGPDGDLLITFAGTEDRLLVEGSLSASQQNQIEEIALDDGTTWTAAEIRDAALAGAATAGADIVSGFSGAEQLAGGKGADLLTGGDGSDTYVFTAGDGHDTIRDNGFLDTDRIVIHGYTPVETLVSNAGDGDDLRLTFEGQPDDSILVRGGLAGTNADTIEQIVFDDGTVWTTADLARLAAEGQASDGNDRISGSAAGDDLEGGKGDDFLSGGDGSDTYVFNRGDGRDTILDAGFLDTDRILIKGYLPDEVRLKAADNGASLLIAFAGNGTDAILVRETLKGTNADTVEVIAFEDGTTWGAAEISARLLLDKGTDAADRITAFASNDTISGREGDDLLAGEGGDDTYVYRRGDGFDIIDETAFDTGDVLRLEGIAPETVILQRGVADDLEVIVAATADDAGDDGRITVRGGFSSAAGPGIETIVFDDGTQWQRSEFETLAQRNLATVGADRLEGTSGDDRLEGLTGDDFLSGGAGDDTYVFRRGDGADTIREDGALSGVDRIEIHGYASDEIVFARRGREEPDLLIRLGDNGDQITVINGLAAVSVDTIEEVWIADSGATLSLPDIRAQLVLGAPSDGDDTLIGTSEADTLAGGDGADLLLGGAGDDTYLYRSGDGDDRITDDGASTGDALVLSDLEAANVVWARRSPADGDDLVLRLAGGADRLILTGALADAPAGVDQIRFADGAVWGLAEMRAAVLASATGDDDAQIRGFDGDDLLAGGRGNDWLSGSEGADLYRYFAGDGADIVEDNADSLGDRVEIVDLIAAETSVSRLYRGSDDVVLRFAGRDDTLTIVDALAVDGRGIEQIVFADGTVWTPEIIAGLLDNNAPVAADDGIFTARHGETLTIRAADLLRNDFDADGDSLTVIAVTAGERGVAQLDGDGNVAFSPTDAFIGSTQFTYTVSDGANGLATASVDVRIVPPASARDDDGLSVEEDGFLTIDPLRLLSNDVDGDRMVVAQVFEALNGTVSQSSDGRINFTPGPDFNGTASFRYAANTPEGGRAEATVFIDVLAVNDAPVAQDDAGFVTAENTAFDIPAEALLANDIDADGDTLAILEVTAGDGLSVEMSADGLITITPDAYYFGDTGFTYTVRDAEGLTDTAEVAVRIDAVNDAPEPQNDSFDTEEDTPLILAADALLANDVERDGDVLNVVAVRPGFGGSVELLANGQIVFTPIGEFYGQGHFFYSAEDGHNPAVEARVDVQVNPVNDAPVARDDTYADDATFYLDGTEDVPLVIAIADLLENDTDIDGLTLTVQSVSFAENGVAEIVGDGTIRFTPDADYWGEASFRYVVADEGALVDDATVTMFFAPVGDAPPVAANDTISMFEDVPTVIPAAALLANDTDIDRDTLTISNVQLAPGARGSVSLDANGNVVYVPALNSTRSETFTYTVTDNADGSDTASVTIDVLPVNDAPTAAPDSAQTSLGAPLVLRIADLMSNDTDVDLAPQDYGLLSFLGIRDAGGGSASLYGEEFAVIEFAAGFSGTTAVTYAIADEEDVEDEGTVSIAVVAERAETLTGTAARDLLIGSGEGELLTGGDGDDDLLGRGGDDTLEGGAGADLIDGGEGEDLLTYAGSNAAVRVDLASRVGQGGHAQGDVFDGIENVEGSAFADTLAGDDSANILRGGNGDDVLDGRGGDDRLEGGAGDDVLEGGAGGDHLIGGDGVDTASYASLGEAVTVSLADGTASGGDAAGDTLSGIENLRGSDAGDDLTGDAFANRLEGGRGDDRLDGGEGDDILVGGRGADQLIGGEGFDTADYSLSAEAVVVDLTSATPGGGDAEGDTFVSIERIVGSFHDDVILGDGGDNILTGGLGADRLEGGGGFDTLDFADASEGVAIDLAAGIGTAGEAAGDTYSGFEKVVGTDFADVLTGSAAAEVFDGALGDDTVSGAGGSDSYLFGFGSGADRIAEAGAAGDTDRVVLDEAVAIRDASLVREGDDLLIELEREDGVLVDTLRIESHFAGPETGIEEIVFGGGTVWDRAAIEALQRVGRFNAEDDIVRFADEDETLIIEASRLTANDATEGTADLEIVAVGNAVNAEVSLLADGSVQFLAAPDFNGDAFFDYTVRDPYGRESQATAEVNVRAVNDAPVAVNDGVYTGTEDEALILPIAEIIGNDIDIDGDSLTLTGWFGPLIGHDGAAIAPSPNETGTNGEALLYLGQLIFTPASNHFGFAGFTYEVTDPDGETARGEIELNFLAVNDAPTASNDLLTVRLGQTRTLDADLLLANDSDPEGDAFTLIGVHSPTNGTVALRTVETIENGQPVIRQVFDFDAEALGQASFAYDVEDAFGARSTGLVEINVIPLNDPPLARDDAGFVTTEDTVLAIDPADLLANDLDANNDPLTISALGPFPENGSVAWSADGASILFTPRLDYNGEAGFTYTVDDGRGGTDEGFVSVSVVPANDAPVVLPDEVAAIEDQPLTITAAQAFANDTDPEGDVLFFEDAAFLGVITGDGSIELVEGFSISVGAEALDILMPRDFHGAFALDYAARDGKDAVSAERATITVTVENTRSAPIAVEDHFEVAEDGLLTFPLAALLENDSDEDGDPLHLVSMAEPDDGTLSVEVPAFVYDLPAEDRLGPGATYSATLDDGTPLPGWLAIDTDTGQLSGKPPLATLATLAIVVTAVDGATELTTAHSLQVDGNAGAILSFAPPPEYAGPFQLNYTVADGRDGETEGTIRIDVLPVNDPPAAVDDALSGFEDTPLVILPQDLLANDIDVEGDPLRIVSVVSGENGTAILEGGEIRFTPTANFDGFATFQYLVTDDIDGGDVGNVVIEVVSTNQAPVSLPDRIEGHEDSAVILDPADLLTNDTDPDGDQLSFVSIVSDTANAQVHLRPDGTYALTPRENYTGELNFTYTVTDGRLHSVETANLAVDFLPVNDAPIAGSDAFTINEDTSLTVGLAELLDNDSDVEGETLAVTGVLDPVNGTVAIEGGAVRFTPRADYFGNAGFSYTVADGAGGVSTGLVAITVLPIGDLPIAVVDEGFSTNEDTVLLIGPATLLANDYDPDGEAVQFVGASGPGVAMTPDGRVSFTPLADQNGRFTLQYEIEDASGNRVTGAFAVDVHPIDDAPTAGADELAGIEDELLVVPVAALLDNDSDADGHALSITSVVAVEGGAVRLDGKGNVVFTPQADRDTPATFDYVLTDSSGDAATARVTVSLAPVNDAPTIAEFETLKGVEDEAFSAQLPLSAFADVEGTPLEIDVRGRDGEALPQWLAFDAATRIISGNPPADFNGVVDLTVIASDGEAETTRPLQLIIAPVNDAPETEDDDVDGLEDETVVIPTWRLLANDTDADGDTLAVTAVSGEGDTVAVLDGAGNVVVTRPADVNGDTFVNYTVSDGDAEASGRVRISVTPVNDAPVLPLVDDVEGHEDTPIDFTLPAGLATDVDGDALTYTASRKGGGPLPDWLAFDAAAQRFTGTPPKDFFGSIALTLTVSDGALADSRDFDLVIAPVNDAPALAQPFSDRFVREDDPFDIALQTGLFSDADGDLLSYEITLVDGSPIPAWLEADTETLRLSGTAPQDFNGVLELRVTASDGLLSASDVFSFAVTPVNDPPELDNPLPDRRGLVTGEAFDFAIPADTFSDPDGDPLMLAARLSDGAALPPWMSFNGSRLQGIAPAGAAGIWQVAILASDGEQQNQDVFELEFAEGNAAPIAVDDGPVKARSGSNLSISPADLLKNDRDPDGDALEIVGVEAAEHGSVRIAADGDIIYRANSGFVGSDQFRYVVSDGETASEATVRLNVDDPFAQSHSGGSGSDVLVAQGNGDAILVAGRGADTVIAGSGDDLISAGRGSDIVKARGGDDVIRAGRGGDTILAGAGADDVRGGQGRDNIFGGSGDDSLDGGRGRDKLYGGAGDDFIHGGRGNDLLVGGSGNDEIDGGTGHDRILGGTGNDVLFGGLGRDSFVFREGDGADRIEDFEVPAAGRNFTIDGDRIELRFQGIDDFDALLQVAAQEANGIVFDFGDGDELFLAGMNLSALEKDAFAFI